MKQSARSSGANLGVEARKRDRPSERESDKLERLLKQHRLYLFDGVCPLCHASVRFMMRHERSPDMTFVWMQSPLGQQILGHFALSLTDWDSFVLVDHGKPLFKSSAFARIAEELKPPWSWLRWLRLIPRPLRDWGYDRVARNRYRLFGKYDHCRLPDRSAATRFLNEL